jgi:hypothetical protein
MRADRHGLTSASRCPAIGRLGAIGTVGIGWQLHVNPQAPGRVEEWGTTLSTRPLSPLRIG